MPEPEHDDMLRFLIVCFAGVERASLNSSRLSLEEWLGCPLLRASDEHRFIVRVLRARRTPGHFPSLS